MKSFLWDVYEVGKTTVRMMVYVAVGLLLLWGVFELWRWSYGVLQ